MWGEKCPMQVPAGKHICVHIPHSSTVLAATVWLRVAPFLRECVLCKLECSVITLYNPIKHYTWGGAAQGGTN